MSNPSCSVIPINNPCPTSPDSKCVVYTGAILPNLGVNTNERLQSILQKIDELVGINFTATLASLYDVHLVNPLNGQLLSYDGTLHKWINITPVYQKPLSLTTLGNSGSSSLIADVLNVPTYTLSGLGGVPLSRTITINGTTYDLSADRVFVTGSLTNFSANNFSPLFNTSVSTSTTTPVLSFTAIPQVGNKIYASPDGATGIPLFRSLVPLDIPALNYVTSVGASGPLVSSGGLTPSISIPKATTTISGYLSATDFNVFNNKEGAIVVGNINQYWRGDKSFQNLDTLAVTENINLYYTDARSRAAISAGAGILYNPTTGVISASASSVTISAGAGISITGTYPNFTIASTITQYTDALARLTISSSITAITYNNLTGVFSLTAGYGIPTTTEIAAWNALVTMTYPAAGIAVSTGTGWGTSIIDNSANWNTAYSWGNHALAGYFLAANFNSSFDTRLALKTTTDLAEGTNLYFTNSRAINSTLTGYISGAGTISATDSILSAIQKLNGNITALTTGVSSVFGRTGTVVAVSGDYNTSQVTENTNLYYTDARARASISLTVTGNNGASSYSNTTGILNIPTYTLSGLSGQPLNNNLTSLSGLSYASLAFVKMSASGTFTLDTNTYLTGNQTITLSGDVTGSGTTSIATTIGAGKVTNTMLVNSSFYIGTTLIPLGRASLAQSLTGITSIDGSAATLTTGRTISGTGEATFTTGAFDGSAAVSGSVTLLNSAVTGKVLTGLNLSSGGTILATDSILVAFGRVQNQISALAGGVTYQGVWNASTNTPTITSSVGTKGYYYVVSVTGSTNIDGISDWKLGDWIIFNGTTWDKVDNTDAVSSVNGFTGAVSLTTANISEVTNLYYLDSRARAAISLTTTGNSGAATYNNTTGVFNIPTYTFDGLSPMTTAGDMIYGGVAGAATRLGIGGANTVLHGGASALSWSAVVEADISLSNNVTNNVTTTRHGFVPILPNNATLFFNGQGNFTTPSGLSINNSYSQTGFSGTTVTVVHNWGAYPVVQVVDSTGAVIIPMSIVNNTLNDFTVTFSSAHTGTVIASVGGPQPQAVSVVTSNYSVLTTDRIVKVTTVGIIVTLPTAVGNTGREFLINNTTAGNIFLTTTSSQTINNQITQTIPPYSTLDVYSDGAGYWIV
ncbi:MAG: hypothetical protein WCP46_00030 [Alphaproteobacteria bacterium]